MAEQYTKQVGRRAGRLAMIAALSLTLAACAVTGSQNQPPQPAQQPQSPAPAAPKAVPAAPAVDLSGKTVRVLVNYDAGGATDVRARLLADAVKKHLPGSPVVMVENMSGAGGRTANNYLFNQAEKDGLTIGFYANLVNHNVWAAGEPGILWKDEEFRWVATIGEPHVYLFNPAVVGSVEELFAPKGKVISSGGSASGGASLMMRLSLDAMGLTPEQHQHISGYPGGNPGQRQAMISGEINAMVESMAGYRTGAQPLIEAGQIVAVYQSGTFINGKLVRDPRISDIPAVHEILEQYRPEALDSVEMRGFRLATAIRDANVSVVLPPGVPDEMLAMWRKTMEAVWVDEEFKKRTEEMFGYQWKTMDGPESEALIKELYDTVRQYPEAQKLLQKMASEG